MKYASRIGRALSVVVLMVGVGIVAPASIAHADKPTRTVVVPESIVIPVGEACSFPVALDVPERVSVVVTEFADGRIVTHDRAKLTLTNADTGESLVHITSAMITEVPAGGGEIQVDISGQLFMWFYPGDQGPNGLVEYPGEAFSVNGHTRVTVDEETLVFTSFSIKGKATDICAALATE
ncbi:hypothetical protein [Agromyces badenianii]|uniref:hypothetical protein n=1 Tax=Agromyces badenianii TaxID=2080742 RepID=UPI00105A29E7|nr:hypothetical protein [Agromyces badenianii]